MTISLPFDILHTIYDHVSAKADLARSCLVSKKLLSIAQPLLYSSLQLPILQSLDRSVTSRRPRISTGLAGIRYHSRIENRTQLLLSTLRRNSLLCCMVQLVNIRGFWVEASPEELVAHVTTEGSRILEELLSLLPSVKFFVLRNLLDSLDVDQVVESCQLCQEDGQAAPKFCLVEPLCEPQTEAILTARYDGFVLLPRPEKTHQIEVKWGLLNSKDSLTRIGIPFKESTVLSRFTQLTHLSLFTRNDNPALVFDHLFSTISSLDTLRSLQLVSLGQPIPLPPILDLGKFAKSLPSLLSDLDLKRFQVPTTRVISFLGHLPSSTSLRSFRCWSDEMGGGEARNDAAVNPVEEYGKRGITLIYVEST